MTAEPTDPPKKKRKKTAGDDGPDLRPPTTPVMRAVDAHYSRRLFGGDPQGSLVFDAGRSPLPYRAPRSLDIPFWTWDAGERPLTRLATVGVSEVPLADGTRIELHLALRRDLRVDEEARQRLSMFLATLADFPFRYETPLGRGDFLPEVGEVPLWPGFTGIFLDGLGLADAALERIEGPEGLRIDLHLAVPILPGEVSLLRRRGPVALREVWAEAGTDRFSPERNLLIG